MSGDERRLFDAFTEGLDRSHGLAARRDPALFVAKLNEAIDRDRRPIAIASNRSNSRWYLAGALVTVAAAVLLMTGKGKTPVHESYVTYKTKLGQRASLNLADGSRVTLGPSTTLRVPKGADKALSIEVDGEALFSIAHSAARSVTVVAHGVTTRVLGTEFVVRAYDASLVRVAVREGRVSVQPVTLTPTNATIVTAGEVALSTPNNVPVVESISNPATEFAWADGELVLSDTPLGDALIRLSRWYGKEFRATDPKLLKARVNGVFPAEFRQRDMRNLAGVIKARAEMSEAVVTFTPDP